MCLREKERWGEGGQKTVIQCSCFLDEHCLIGSALCVFSGSSAVSIVVVLEIGLVLETTVRSLVLDLGDSGFFIQTSQDSSVMT